VKLTAEEIERLQRAASVQDEFRRLVIDRVRRYLARGLATAGDYYDQQTPVDPSAVARRLLVRSPWLMEQRPRLARYAAAFPATTPLDVDSFLYWIETTITPKPTIQVVHVMIDRRERVFGQIRSEVTVVSRQVFATHYTNGFLGVSALLRNRIGTRSLAYVCRLDVDGLDGWLGGIGRAIVERSVRIQGRSAFAARRSLIEAFGTM
jgi:hypothetical protein